VLGRALVLCFVAGCGETARPATVRIEPLPASPAPAATRAPRPPATATAEHLPTFEEAWAAAEMVDAGAVLTRDELVAPVEHAGFVMSCGTPNDTRVRVKIAVLQGRAAGVTVTLDPDDATVRACIDAAARRLTWPKSLRMDAVSTEY